MKPPAFLLLALAPFAAWAGPFGLEAGQSLDSLRAQLRPTADPLVYELPAPPLTHPKFTRHTLGFAPASGLATITAASAPIACDGAGTEVKALYTFVEDQLREKYGAPTRTLDELASGSVWRQPTEWMVALAREERYLLLSWSAAKEAQLPPRLASIELTVQALNPTTALVKLTYRFDNAPDFDAAPKFPAPSSL